MRLRMLLPLLLASLLGAQGPATRDLLWTKLGAEVRQQAKELDGVLGLVLRDLTDGRELALDADASFPTASCIKVAIVAELYRQAQSGTGARLTDPYTILEKDLVPDSYLLGNLTPGVTRLTNRDLAACVVAVSDNAAANILIDRVGMENVNRMLDGLGLKGTRLRRKMMDLGAAKEGRENVSTPRELAALLEAIYRGRLLDAAMTRDFLQLFCTPKSDPLAAGLPDGVPAATKPGALDGVRCGVALVLLEGRPYVLAVMTAYDRDEAAAERTLTRISADAWHYFKAVSVSSDLGRFMAPATP